MSSRKTARQFSEHLDRVLAGETTESSDPLSTLGVEIAHDRTLDPSPEFAARLRRRLLTRPSGEIAPRRRALSLAGIAVLALGLAGVLVLMGSTPSASMLLARAAQAAAVEPGQIEHVVYRNSAAMDCSEPVYLTLDEYWNRFESLSQGGVVLVESLLVLHAAGDEPLAQPQLVFRTTESRFCLHDFGASGAVLTDSDSEGCVSLAPQSGTAPRQRAGGVQSWVIWMRELEGAVVVEQVDFEERRVFRVSCVAESGEPETARCGEGVAILIDEETYMPLRLSFQYGGLQLASEVYEYAVFDPGELTHDPFAWPPEGEWAEVAPSTHHSCSAGPIQ
jgi:hypothetical protein